MSKEIIEIKAVLDNQHQDTKLGQLVGKVQASSIRVLVKGYFVKREMVLVLLCNCLVRDGRSYAIKSAHRGNWCYSVCVIFWSWMAEVMQ